MIAGNGGVAIDDNSVAFTGDIDTIGFGRAGNSVFALEVTVEGLVLPLVLEMVMLADLLVAMVHSLKLTEEPSDRARPATPLLLTVESVTVA